MSDIVIFDTNANSIKSHLTSQNSKSFVGNPEALIFQDGTAEGDASIVRLRKLFETVPQKYLTVEKGLVREMTDPEKLVIDSQIQADLDAKEALRIGSLDSLLQDTKENDFMMQKVDSIIDSITDIDGMKVFIKRVVRFIVKQQKPDFIGRNL